MRIEMRGITIIEVLIAAGMLVMVMLVAVFFSARVFELPRFQFEQGRIANTALVQMDRMSNLIREGNITHKGRNRITVDSDEGRVTYRLNGDKLRRQVQGGPPVIIARGIRNLNPSASEIIPGPGSGSVPGPVSFPAPLGPLGPVSFPAPASGTPVDMFEYYSIGGPKALRLRPNNSSGPLGRVVITLVVDTDEDQLPEAATVRTEVYVRQ